MICKYSKALVTGGAGFIGSHLVERLINEGFEVIVLDNLETGNLENIAQCESDGLTFVRGDIRNLNLVEKTMKDVDVIFHEAALVGIEGSVRNPILTNDINVSGTLNVLQASIDNDVKRFVYASSAAIYGTSLPSRKTENTIPRPASPYGISKLAAENYVEIFNELYGIETVSLRYFNVYGPRQGFDIQEVYGSVITIFIYRLLRNMSPIVYGDGEQTRDFVYVKDVVEANIQAMRSKKAVGEVINIGTGRETSVNQVAETLKDILEKGHIKSIYCAPRPGDVRHGHADIDKARKILGYSPKFSIKEGLVGLVDWYSKNNPKSDSQADFVPKR